MPHYPTAEERFNARMGHGGKKILHIEHWSNPDAETYLTGIDHYDHPRECRKRLYELYPMLNLPIPDSDEPIPRPKLDGNESSDSQSHSVRWGDGETATFLHGEQFFKTEEDVFAFSPLAHADMREWKFVVENGDFTSEEAVYNAYRPRYPAEWGDRAPAGSLSDVGFYNTTFMWPMLTFGWEMFLATCLDEEFERIMEEFGEINRRVFKAFSRLPINFCGCHDDLFTTRGPVCSRDWMNKYVWPRYEEYWGYMRDKGVHVDFTTDGCPDAYVDDIYACGARGLITEPYADFKAIAKKYPDILLAGEGDNRILTYGSKEDIEKMVLNMVETGKQCGGYFMCIGNHIPWNVPGESIKYYLDYSDKYAYR